MSFREYEIRNKPLFASMKRAKEALLKPHNKVCCIDDFFTYLESNYGEEKDYIEFITFYDYVNQVDGFHYNIAYIYTSPSLRVRDLLFAQREQITENTGWYPMVSGKRANFTKIKNSQSHDFYKLMKHKSPFFHLGKPLSIKNVAKDISSTAMLLKCEKGNILLDTGFGIDEDVIDCVDFIFISHFHKDHTGGLYDFLRQREVPVVLSSITLTYLINLLDIEQTDKERLVRNSVLIEKIINNSQISQSVEFFDSFHCPGAYGLKYKFYKECLIYPGDMCLNNGFYDFSNDFKLVYSNAYYEKTTVITDCALVPRGDFAITDENFENIVSKVEFSLQNQIFVSRNCEILFNIYIRLFKHSVQNNKQWLFVVNNELYDLLQNTLRTWLLDSCNEDPFIKHVIGNSSINYAETQRLYDLSNVSQFLGYKDKKIFYFLTINELGEIHKIIGDDRMDLFLTGPLATTKNIDESLKEFQFNTINKLSSPDWSFHSEKKAIQMFLQQPTNQNLNYLLFHAYPKDLKRLINEFPEKTQNRITFISKKELKI